MTTMNLKAKRIISVILSVCILFSFMSTAVFADEQTVSSEDEKIVLGEYGLFYDAYAVSDDTMNICILSSKGEKIELSAVNDIKVINLGVVKGVYTKASEKVYNFADGEMDDVISLLDVYEYYYYHEPYVANYILDNEGHVDTVYLAGNIDFAKEMKTSFARWRGLYGEYNKGKSTIGGYELYESSIIFGYQYDLNDLNVFLMAKDDLVDKQRYLTTIYDMNPDNKATVLFIKCDKVVYSTALIQSITSAKNSEGKNVHKLVLKNEGSTFTKYTENKSIIDNYKYGSENDTDYSVDIASGFYPGAVIMYGENENGEINKVIKLYPLSSKTGEFYDETPYYKTDLFASWDGNVIQGNNHIEACYSFVTYGKVIEKSTLYDTFTIECTTKRGVDDKPVKQNFKYDYDMSIYVVDYSKEKDKIYVGSKEDIQLGSYVLVSRKHSYPRNIIVYKNFQPETYLGLVHVSGVKLNKTELSMNVGNVESLIETVVPYSASYKDVTWESSNPDVASVEDGVITAKSAGQATITVTTDDNEKAASCTVVVGKKQQMSMTDIITDNGIKFSVNLSPEPKGRLIAALYDDAGNVVEAKVLDAQAVNNFTFSKSGVKVKVFWVDSLLRPYVDAIEKIL